MEADQQPEPLKIQAKAIDFVQFPIPTETEFTSQLNHRFHENKPQYLRKEERKDSETDQLTEALKIEKNDNNFLKLPSEFTPKLNQNNLFLFKPPTDISSILEKLQSQSTSKISVTDNPFAFNTRRIIARTRRERSYVPYNILKKRETRLLAAAYVSNVELLTKYLEDGVNPNCSDALKRSPLHLAASRGYVDIVSQLLIHGASPDAKDQLGNTPMHLAVCSASLPNFNLVVRMLLNVGASIRATDCAGKTPLDLAKSKLSMMAKRRNSTPESVYMLCHMTSLTKMLFHKKQQEEIDDLSSMLEGLTTHELDKEINDLLNDIERLEVSTGTSE